VDVAHDDITHHAEDEGDLAFMRKFVRPEEDLREQRRRPVDRRISLFQVEERRLH